jgi:inorganic pyrophosphatase
MVTLKSGIIWLLLLVVLQISLFYLPNTLKHKNGRNFHPWHDVNPKYNTSDLIDVYIEIPKGSRTKYEIDKQYGLIRVDRVLPNGLRSPQNYGFIPKTYYLDNDPLDINVFSSGEFVPGSLVKARVVGILKMDDTGDLDDKIIAVSADDKEYEHIKDISELPIEELVTFLKTYKGDRVKILGIEGKEKALEAIELGYKLYIDKFADIYSDI